MIFCSTSEKKLDVLIVNLVVGTDDDKISKIKLDEKKCKSLIIQKIADSHLEYIKDTVTAKDIFETLENIFERKSISSQLFLRRKLLTMKCEEGGSIEDHFLEFDKVVRNLKSTGAKIDDLDVVCHMLLTLLVHLIRLLQHWKH